MASGVNRKQVEAEAILSYMGDVCAVAFSLLFGSGLGETDMLEGVMKDVLQPLPQSFCAPLFVVFCLTFLLPVFFVVSLVFSQHLPSSFLSSFSATPGKKGRWNGQKTAEMRHLLPNKTDKEYHATTTKRNGTTRKRRQQRRRTRTSQNSNARTTPQDNLMGISRMAAQMLSMRHHVEPTVWTCHEV